MISYFCCHLQAISNNERTSFVASGWRMTSLIVSGMMLTWYQTQRFVETNISFFGWKNAHKFNVNTVFCWTQNIKKLLKIPYSKSHVSMAVHRVGRTLLLDELDIQELFVSSSQVQQGLFQLLLFNFSDFYTLFKILSQQ